MCLNFLVRFNKADWKAPGKKKKKKAEQNIHVWVVTAVGRIKKETASTSQDLKMNESQQALSK